MSAGGAEVERINGYDEYQLDDTELCGAIGTLYITSTYTTSTVSNDGQFAQDKVHYRDTFDFVRV